MDLRRDFLTFWIYFILTVIARFVVQSASDDMSAHGRADAETFTSPSGGMIRDLDLTTAEDSTASMMPMKIGADIRFPFWIAGTAFPW